MLERIRPLRISAQTRLQTFLNTTNNSHNSFVYCFGYTGFFHIDFGLSPRLLHLSRTSQWNRSPAKCIFIFAVIMNFGQLQTVRILYIFCSCMVDIEQVSPSSAQFKNAVRRPRTRSARGHEDIVMEAEEFGKVVKQKCMKQGAHYQYCQFGSSSGQLCCPSKQQYTKH
jgi:hypothetical protein